MNLRNLIIQDLRDNINKDLNYSSDYFDITNDKQLLQYYKDCLHFKSYNQGYDECVRDHPDNDNITYLT